MILLKKERYFQMLICAFFSNVLWENLHSYLYDNYKGGKITELILLQASLVDTALIAVLLLPFLYFAFLKRNSWLILVMGILIAIPIEWRALYYGTWAYTAYMPVIPFINTGLTPTVQLGLLGYLSYRIQILFK